MNEKSENLNHLRHSAAHLLAAAVLKLWPDTKPTIGPAIESGFYYDFEFASPISDADLSKIEKEMTKLLPHWTKFDHREVSEDEAKEIFKHNSYKLELITEIVEKNEKITLYSIGKPSTHLEDNSFFEDLCRGGHSKDPSKEIGAFKLLSLAGAYWRGSEKNKMLTRIYGTAFLTKKELDEYLYMLEEAKKRDHKKLGPELDLFFFTETAPGMPYWLPKGLVLYNALYDFARKMYRKYGYQEVATPMLNKKELYETSGHWTHYKDDMFIASMRENEIFGVKPMNCPNAMTIFAAKTRSYNDFPLRLAETNMLHRYELSGTLNGLFRTRQFRQDDAHIFISPELIKDEFENLMNMIEEVYQAFGISYRLRFGTRPEKFLGDAKDWDYAEERLKAVLEASKKEYATVEGEGAFYGPKIDILMKDTLGREWQTGTVQLDLQQPKRFGLKYANNNGEDSIPIVFHRAIYGSFERFLGILIEHYAGAFPLWISPVQVVIAPVSDKFTEFAQKVYDELNQAGIRTELKTSNQTLGAKIREATLQKIPYMCIIGEKEINASEKEVFISVRERSGKDLGQLSLSQFISQLKDEIEQKL